MASTRAPKCRAPAGNAATVTINVSPAATPTPDPASAGSNSATPIPNVCDAPSTSGWGLAALVAGMLVVMVVALGLTSGGGREVTSESNMDRPRRAGRHPGS